MDKERYGSAKIEIDEVLGTLKKEKNKELPEKKKSFFDLLGEE